MVSVTWENTSVKNIGKKLVFLKINANNPIEK